MTAQAAALGGTAAGYAVLAGTAASCTTSTITGKVGVDFNPPTTAGCNAQHAHAAYMAFQGALGTKPNCTDSITPDTFTGGSSSLGTGTHCAAAALTFTDHTLNLTGSGPWNFVITAGFTTTNLNVVLPTGGNPCNVFWWVGADATLTVNNGATVPVTPFQGTILGAGDITLTGTAGHTSALTLTGHVWATHAVTVTNATIIGCTAGGTVPGQGCKNGAGQDTDENSDQSKDKADNNKSASSSSNGDNNGKNSEGNGDKGAEGCDSENSKQDNSNQEMSKQDNSNQDNKKQSD